MYVHFFWFIGQNQLNNPTKTPQYILYSTPPSHENFVYVAMGDSLTAGVGASTQAQTYPYRLAEHLSQKQSNVQVLNLGVPGAKTDDLISTQLPMALNSSANLITIFVGTNDVLNHYTLSAFRHNYQLILDTLSTKPNTKVELINIPYLGSQKLISFPLDNLYDLRVQQFNQVIAELGQKYHYKVIDLYTPTNTTFWQNPEMYSPDLFHPSDKGYNLWSEIINDAN